MKSNYIRIERYSTNQYSLINLNTDAIFSTQFKIGLHIIWVHVSQQSLPN